jgi:hypothetical protein
LNLLPQKEVIHYHLHINQPSTMPLKQIWCCKPCLLKLGDKWPTIEENQLFCTTDWPGHWVGALALVSRSSIPATHRIRYSKNHRPWLMWLFPQIIFYHTTWCSWWVVQSLDQSHTG